MTFTPIAKNFMLYFRLIYMLSILCVRLTIKVKVGIPESFKVGWYPPKKLGRVTLSRRSGEGKGEDEAWDRQTMFSPLAKWSRCVMVSCYLRSFSRSKYFRGEKRTSKGNDSLKEKIISCLLALFFSHIVFVLWY